MLRERRSFAGLEPLATAARGRPSYATVEPLLERLYPRTFEWSRQAADGSTVTEQAPLFGDLIDAVKWYADREEGAAGGAYLENLPDTRATMDDPIEHGVSFHPNGGTGPMLTYRVRFETPGTYVVWVRAYSTGTEDNGIHAGIDGTFPGSGERVQWCAGKHQWTWSSAQRTTSNHCGTPGTITLDVDSAGVHEIHFSLREDGFEFEPGVFSADAPAKCEAAAAQLRRAKLRTVVETSGNLPVHVAIAAPTPQSLHGGSGRFRVHFENACCFLIRPLACERSSQV